VSSILTRASKLFLISASLTTQAVQRALTISSHVLAIPAKY
jgi:hypothetical protein